MSPFSISNPAGIFEDIYGPILPKFRVSVVVEAVLSR